MLTVQIIHQTDPSVTTIKFSGELTHESIRHHARALDAFYLGEGRERQNLEALIKSLDLDPETTFQESNT